MIEWRAYANLIAVRSHGEHGAIIDVFTAEKGRVRGLVRGGQGRRMRPVLQIGAGVDVVWKARLATQLGVFQVEPVHSRVAIMRDGLRLTALNAMAGLLCFGLAENQAFPELFEATDMLLDALDSEDMWFDRFVGWELIFLRNLGFGLDLNKCVRTGVTENLCYISPKTGAAVSRDAAGIWANKLLPFPRALKMGIGINRAAFRECLALTEYFILHHLIPHLGGDGLPSARQRLAQLVE